MFKDDIIATHISQRLAYSLLTYFSKYSTVLNKIFKHTTVWNLTIKIMSVGHLTQHKLVRAGNETQMIAHLTSRQSDLAEDQTCCRTPC